MPPRQALNCRSPSHSDPKLCSLTQIFVLMPTWRSLPAGRRSRCPCLMYCEKCHCCWIGCLLSPSQLCWQSVRHIANKSMSMSAILQRQFRRIFRPWYKALGLPCYPGTLMTPCRLGSGDTAAFQRQRCSHSPSGQGAQSAGFDAQVLDLSNNQLEDAAITHLAAASWPCLGRLDLSCTGLGHAGLQQLWRSISTDSSSSSSSRCWPALTDLNVSGNNMLHGSLFLPAPLSGTAGAATGWACQLTGLDLSDTSLSTSSIQQLTKVSWPRLERIILSGNSLPASAIEQLTKAHRSYLKQLDLSRSGLATAATRHLIQACWPHLEELSLSGNSLTAVAVRQLTMAL